MSGVKYPKISIVTPSFNQGQYLESAIRSVLSQGYPNLEYIVVDGGSTDNSLEIIRKHSHHLHYWCSEADDGHYAAINKGFEKASGDIYAWLNSDDMFCPNAFRIIGTIFYQFPELAWLTTLKQIVWDIHGHCKTIKRIPGYSRKAFLDGRYFTRKFSGLGFIQQESTFWRCELWEKVGGVRTKFNLAGDFDLWARFFIYEDLYGVDQPLGGFRVHDKNRSLQKNKYLYEAEQILEEMRQRLNWTRNTDQPVFGDSIKRLPIIRRLAEFFNLSLKNEYSGTNISQVDRLQGNEWKLTTAFF